jgi:hypothetical protein
LFLGYMPALFCLVSLYSSGFCQFNFFSIIR